MVPGHTSSRSSREHTCRSGTSLVSLVARLSRRSSLSSPPAQSNHGRARALDLNQEKSAGIFTATAEQRGLHAKRLIAKWSGLGSLTPREFEVCARVDGRVLVFVFVFGGGAPWTGSVWSACAVAAPSAGRVETPPHRLLSYASRIFLCC